MPGEFLAIFCFLGWFFSHFLLVCKLAYYYCKLLILAAGAAGVGVVVWCDTPGVCPNHFNLLCIVIVHGIDLHLLRVFSSLCSVYLSKKRSNESMFNICLDRLAMLFRRNENES